MFNKCMDCGNYGGTSLICIFACEREEKMKKNKNDHCKRSDCQYYDHKNFNNNCSISNTEHKNINGCRVFRRKREEEKRD